MILFVRERKANSTLIGNYEENCTAVVHAGKLIEFISGDVPPIKLNKLYHLKKNSPNNYEIIGTNYTLKYLGSQRIELRK